jgi:enoyl-CoA hydratase/carnithine racemase
MYIDYEVADRIATITLNRPEAANAQNPELLDELDAAWTRAAEDNDVSVIVLRANGKHFSAGHDLRGGGPVPDKITLDFIIQHELSATSSTPCAGATFRSRRSPPSRVGASPAGCCCAGRAT